MKKAHTILFIIACVIGLVADDIKTSPKLNDKQLYEIRDAQVKMFQAKTLLEETPQYKAFVAAQDNLNNLALKVQRETGCIPPHWQMSQDLECIAVPEPAKK